MDKDTFLRFDGYIVIAVVVVIVAIGTLLIAPLSVDMVFLTTVAGMLFVRLSVELSQGELRGWHVSGGRRAGCVRWTDLPLLVRREYALISPPGYGPPRVVRR